MEKILFLDANETIVDVVLLAKKQGYYTITCDNKKENKGHLYSDKQYYISTYNLEELRNMIKEEAVDGVIYFTSAHGLYGASRLCEEFKFRPIPFDVVEVMSDKDKFRNFLRENRLPHPSYLVLDDENYVIEEEFRYPVIVKPVDAGGNNGITKVINSEMLPDAIRFAFTCSRSKRVIVEQYIESDLQINGDCIIENGKVKIAYLGKYLYKNADTIIPYATVFSPEILSQELRDNIIALIDKVVSATRMKTGVINVELRVEKTTKEIYFIEINTRHSGNRIYNLMDEALNISTAACAINLALDKATDNIDNTKAECHNAYCILTSEKDGVLDELVISDELLQHTTHSQVFVGNGDKVSEFKFLQNRLALLHLSFSSHKEMLDIIENINKYYTIKLI